MRFAALGISFLLAFLSGCVAIVNIPGSAQEGRTRLQHKERAAPERRIVDLVNEARGRGRKCGNTYYKAVRPLAWNSVLGQAALAHSEDMAQNGFLSHTGSSGSNPGNRIAKLGYKWAMYGENIGQGYGTPEEAVQGWLKSEAHCKNIMEPDFRDAGAAYARSSKLRNYWTIDFGAPGR